MKRYLLFTLLLALMLSIFSLSRATTVQVGEGTGTTFALPIYVGYDYNYSQQIYTHAQIGHSGPISKIRFFYASGSITNSKDWTIYLGHTTKTVFNSDTDWEPLANLTQVFTGDVSSLLPAANNWMEITLDTPFFYNSTNENLLIAVHEYTPGRSWMNWGSFSAGTQVYRGIQYYSNTTNPDPSNPPTASRTSNINRIQLVFSNTQAPPAPSLWSPIDNCNLVAGESLLWRPTASVAETRTYDLYLGTTVNPPLFVSNLTTPTYQPTLLPNTTYYWRVVAKNEIGSSPPSELRSFRYLGPVPEESVQVGEGTGSTSYYPVYGGYDYSYSQQIYTHAQIMRFGQITKLRFYYVSAGDIGYNKNWTIWLGHTTKTVFNSDTDWEPLANLTQVFAGDVSSLLPEPGNWMEIPLDTPFFYNNSENLLVAVHEYALGASWMNWGSFSAGTQVYRGIQYYSHTTNPDPSNPPTASRSSNINRIQIVFSSTQAPPAPSLWSPLNNGVLAAGDRLYWKPTVSVSAPTNYDLYLGTTANPPLFASNITSTSYLPELQPNTTYYWKVVAKNGTGSSAPSEVWSFYTLDSSQAVTAEVGDGTGSTSYFPVYGGYDYSYSQQIYTHAQIKRFGQITKLRFYYVSGDIGYNKNWTIYLGHTTKMVFDSDTDWEDVANLTQVFAGDVSSLLPEPGNWIEIPLDIPFFYDNTNENLIVAIHEYALGASWMDWGAFSTGIQVYRGIQYYSNTINPDPNSPPTASRRTSDINRIQIVFSSTQAPPAPSLWSPLNNGNLVAGDRLYWKPTVSVSAPTNYDLYLGTTANPPLFASNITSTSYLPELQPNTTYYWKVVAKNGTGSSAPSEVWSFRSLDSSQAVTAQVGDGTGNISYLPVYGGYDYNYSQQIYTHAQIRNSGQITKLRFYYVSDGDIGYSKNWTIWLGHTTKMVFNSTTDWEPLANLTQVFVGDVSSLLPEPGNWMEIPLQTPFFYNNSENLLIAIHEYALGASWMNWGSFSAGIRVYRGVQYYSYTINPDPSSPPAASRITSDINRIQLVFSNNQVPPAPSLWSPANGGYYVEGDRLYWAPTIDVSGSTNYDLYLGTTANPPLIASNLSSTSYQPNLQPNTIYYWKVVAKNERYNSAPSEVWSFRTLDLIQAATVQVGEGTATTSYLPYHGGYDYNYSQQIYTQAQIDHSALITKLRLYYVSGDIANGKKWTIYMGHTSKNVFTTNIDWEDVADLTQVFDGDVSLLLPEPNNWMEIPLQTPFFYNNSGNLLIAVHETTLDWSVMSWGSLFNGYGVNRGIQYYSYTINPDPNSPPTASGRADRINSIQLGFITPPPPPPVVEVTISGANAVLTWEQVPEANSYKVYASEDPYNFGPVPIATVNTNSYTLPLGAAKRFFKVTAVAE